jgi:hypothetical protein
MRNKTVVGKPEGNGNLEDLGVDKTIIIKFMLQKEGTRFL